MDIFAQEWGGESVDGSNVTYSWLKVDMFGGGGGDVSARARGLGTPKA